MHDFYFVTDVGGLQDRRNWAFSELFFGGIFSFGAPAANLFFWKVKDFCLFVLNEVLCYFSPQIELCF
jgi:hypothetical protein